MREASRIASHALTEARPGPFSSFHLHMWIGIAAYSDGLATDPGLSGHLDRVLELGDQQGIHLFDFHAWCHKIMEAMAVDDIAAGATALQKAKALDPGLRGARLVLILCEIGQRMMERDWPAAVKLAEESLTASPDFGGWVFGAQSLRVGLAQALTMLGEHERASRHLAGPLDFARRLPSPYFHMMANFIQAAGAYARHDLERGDAHLRAALGIARAKGFRHFHPWWSPPFFAPLLARALEADIEADWVTLLIARQRVKPPSADAHAWIYPVRIHVLGRFSVLLNGVPMVQQGKAQRRGSRIAQAAGRARRAFDSG